jgi:hypothetical protein
MTSSVSIDVAACEIAQPRPENLISKDRVAIERDIDGDLVAAERIHSVGVRVGILDRSVIPQVL